MTNDRIIVTHLITDLITAGAETALYRLLLNTDRSKYEPVVIALRNADGEIANKISSLDIRIVDLKMLPLWRIEKLYLLYRELRRLRPTILHCWLIHPNIIGRAFGRIARVPVIIGTRRSERNVDRFAAWLNSCLVNWSNCVIAVSENARVAELRETRVNPMQVITVPNGIDTRIFNDNRSLRSRHVIRTQLGISEKNILIGSVGRLAEAKGHVDLLRAFQIVTKEFPQTRLVIAGAGILLSELAQLSISLGIEDKIQFCGVRSDIPEFLHAIDLFAFPSHWEGMPNALMEAMASGVPIVATNISAIPELVDHNVHGLLVPANAPNDLASAISTLLNDANLCKRMGTAAQMRIQKEFTIENTAQKTMSVYEECVKKIKLKGN